jgi:hypothetical protein
MDGNVCILNERKKKNLKPEAIGESYKSSYEHD